ncbi:hypothetical protein QF042_001720 [Pedobacter sp. W3I1]|uniref:DUF4091 domain-containing protein n=1 Tax=Pedobacter sp. W3I1 TaxID=3042291 RepID=UPI00277E137B|nr:DUF4091 domain-containing protein [Pedobacter sp. W3I1]MDQ0638155.1 hypothetical protein [Pedobacter sp. W3I1]
MKYLFLLCFLGFYLTTEAQNRPHANTDWSKVKPGLQVSFASSNIRFAKEALPEIAMQKTWSTKAWKGEKINTQVLLWSGEQSKPIKLQVSDLKDAQGNVIKKENMSSGFLKYVITDEFKDGCGYRKAKDFDSSYVADIIDTKTAAVSLSKNNTQPVWLSIKVPANAKPGSYTGQIKVIGAQEQVLQIAVQVVDRTLPPASKWKYDLDLWQHPQAIARVHHVQTWSAEHFSLMKAYYQMLANAGQKTITASIVNEPWGHQTFDDYPSLIKWTKKKDGSWKYDYSLFDQYIAFVMECGITDRINCYSMVPWKIAFTYYDENLGQEAVLKDAIGSEAYNRFWKTMLIDFTAHLKQKGWFSKTYIAMDERPMEAMKAVIKLLKETDKDWKIALAGDYHNEIEGDIDNYCIASKWDFPAEVLQKRRQQGKISTWYTCCTEPYPNAFTFSSPAEQVWMGWYSANKTLDGYVRWAYNSWTKNPLVDSRFITWPAGDTYQIYPGPLSSVRFEKLIEGAQDFEKISILKAQYATDKNTKQLSELNMALGTFDIKLLATTSADEMLQKVKNLLND